MSNRLISNSQIGKMLHALGVQYSKNGNEIKPNKRNNPLPISYRNYYQTLFDAEWEILISEKYAIKSKCNNLNYYFVTKEGIIFLKQLGYKFKFNTDK